MLTTLLQAATQPVDDPWGQVRGALIGALLLIIAAGATLVVKWLNTLSRRLDVVSSTATEANAKANVNSQRITNTAEHVRQVDGKQTDLAEKVGAVSVAARLSRVVDDRPNS